MLNLISWMIILAFLSGQIVRIPVGQQGGLILLDLIVVAIVGVGLYKRLFRNSPFYIKAALIFSLMALTSLILTPVKLDQVEFLISLSYLVRFTIYILAGWYIAVEAVPKFGILLVKTIVFSGVTLSILGLLQFIFLPDLGFLAKDLWDPHFFRTASTFLDPNFLGSFLTVSLLVLFFATKNWDKIKILQFILIYLALVTTFSRGSYLAFLVAFITASILAKSLRKALFSGLLFLLLLLSFNLYQNAVATPRGVDREQSAANRLETWQQGIKLFEKHPILGVGFNTYKFALRQYDYADEDFLRSKGSTTNDSSLLYVASTTGLVGLTFYILFLASLFYSGWRSYKRKNIYGMILISILSGLVAQSYFINNLFYPFILFTILLIAALAYDKD